MNDPGLEAVSETLFVPLYSLALESLSNHPVISDPEAVALTKKLNGMFHGLGKPIYRRLARGKLNGLLVTLLALRIRRFDGYVRDFLQRVPDAIVVNLGCGLDDRRRRVDNGKMEWFDLDLPEVMALRRQLLPAGERFHALPTSVLDFAWLKEIPKVPGERVLFVAEGLLMYLPEPGVRELVLELHRAFPGSELVAEVASSSVVRMMQGRLGRRKLRRQLGLSQDVVYGFGIKESHALEGWAPGIQFLDEWTYFDDRIPKLWWIRPFGIFNKVRHEQWTVHYRLGKG